MDKQTLKASDLTTLAESMLDVQRDADAARKADANVIRGIESGDRTIRLPDTLK
jgi:hypothetical protein